MRLIHGISLSGLMIASWGMAQEPGPVPETRPARQEESAEPPATAAEADVPEVEAQPRVVGQPRTQEELDAFLAVQGAPSPSEKIALGEKFLSMFAESGLTSFVHAEMAESFRQIDDIDSFLQHAEKALEELPGQPSLQAPMAFYYSERGEPEKALAAASQALETLGTMEKPAQLSASEWAMQKFYLSGEAHYAIGRVKLSESRKNEEELDEEALDESIRHLEQALDANPTHEFACYRLAEAYQRKGDLKTSIEKYARTVAIGGLVSSYAQLRLDEILKVQEPESPVDEIIETQKEQISQEQEERQQLLAQIEAEAAAEAAAAAAAAALIQQSTGVPPGTTAESPSRQPESQQPPGREL